MSELAPSFAGYDGFLRDLKQRIQAAQIKIIFDKVVKPIEREWYVRAALEYGWSRSILAHQIETKLFERQGKTITNFERTLPALQSDFAQQVLNDPFNFEFLTIQKDTLSGMGCCISTTWRASARSLTPCGFKLQAFSPYSPTPYSGSINLGLIQYEGCNLHRNQKTRYEEDCIEAVHFDRWRYGSAS